MLIIALLLLVVCMFAGLVACDDNDDNDYNVGNYDGSRFEGVDDSIHADMLDAYINGGLSYSYAHEEEYPIWVFYSPHFYSSTEVQYWSNVNLSVRYHWTMYSYNDESLESSGFGAYLEIFGFDNKASADANESKVDAYVAEFTDGGEYVTFIKSRPYDNVIMYESRQGLFNDFKNSTMPAGKITQKKLDFVNNAIAKELKESESVYYYFNPGQYFNVEANPVIGNCTRHYYATENEDEFFGYDTPNGGNPGGCVNQVAEENRTASSYTEQDGETYYAFLQEKPGIRLEHPYSTDTSRYEVTGFFYDTATATLNIPAEYNGLPVTSIDLWNNDFSGVTAITIPNSITNIKLDGDFCGITSLTIPKSVANIELSGFYNLETITVASDNPTLYSKNNCIIVKSGYNAGTLLAGCKNSVIPTDGSVTRIGRFAFSQCTTITSINIPDGVIAIDQYSFEYCSGLTNIVLPDSVQYIDTDAFRACYNLESITIPDINASLNGLRFDSCFNLKNITFKGTMAKWKEVYSDKYDESTGNFTVHCTDGDLDKNGNEI